MNNNQQREEMIMGEETERDERGINSQSNSTKMEISRVKGSD